MPGARIASRRSRSERRVRVGVRKQRIEVAGRRMEQAVRWPGPLVLIERRGASHGALFDVRRERAPGAPVVDAVLAANGRGLFSPRSEVHGRPRADADQPRTGVAYQHNAAFREAPLPAGREHRGRCRQRLRPANPGATNPRSPPLVRRPVSSLFHAGGFFRHFFGLRAHAPDRRRRPLAGSRRSLDARLPWALAAPRTATGKIACHPSRSCVIVDLGQPM